MVRASMGKRARIGGLPSGLFRGYGGLHKVLDSGLTYNAGLSYHTQSEAGEIDLYAETEPDRAVAVQKQLLEEAKKWSEPGYFSEAELTDVRRLLLIDHKRELNSPSAYGKTLAFWWSTTGLDYYGSYLDNLRATNLADVRRFAKTYLVGKPYVASILTSPDGAAKSGLKDTSKDLIAKTLKEVPSELRK